MNEMSKRDVENWLCRSVPIGDIARDHCDELSMYYWECDCGVKRTRGGSCDVCGCIDIPALDGVEGVIDYE